MEWLDNLPQTIENFQALIGAILALLTALGAFLKKTGDDAKRHARGEVQAYEDARDRGIREGVLPWAIKQLHRMSAFKKLATGSTKSDKRRALKGLIVQGIYDQLGPRAAGELTPERLEQYADWGHALWAEREHVLKGEFREFLKDVEEREPELLGGATVEAVPGFPADGSGEGNALTPVAHEPTGKPSSEPAE